MMWPTDWHHSNNGAPWNFFFSQRASDIKLIHWILSTIWLTGMIVFDVHSPKSWCTLLQRVARRLCYWTYLLKTRFLMLLVVWCVTAQCVCPVGENVTHRKALVVWVMFVGERTTWWWLCWPHFGEQRDEDLLPVIWKPTLTWPLLHCSGLYYPWPCFPGGASCRGPPTAPRTTPLSP